MQKSAHYRTHVRYDLNVAFRHTVDVYTRMMQLLWHNSAIIYAGRNMNKEALNLDSMDDHRQV